MRERKGQKGGGGRKGKTGGQRIRFLSKKERERGA